MKRGLTFDDSACIHDGMELCMYVRMYVYFARCMASRLAV